jgi:hypothetical protein
LAGKFRLSNQLTQALLNVRDKFQSQGDVSENLIQLLYSSQSQSNTVDNPLKMIQDVPTRWWSTYSMIIRFLELLPWLYILVTKGHLSKDEMLNRDEVEELMELNELLEPFMLAQQVLEGQKYVTLSLVPYLISEIRDKINLVVTNGRSVGVRALAEDMLLHATKGFNVRFFNTICSSFLYNISLIVVNYLP